jgi:uncharacterized protein (TIGR01777 family)
MKVAVTGATGFIGIPLCKELVRTGYDLTVFTRNFDSAKKKLGNSVNYMEWDASKEIPGDSFRNINAVINLAGESIGDGRWTAERKKRIVESRVLTTRRIVEAIATNPHQQLTLINASAVGYYGPRKDEKICEDGSCGRDFLASVCMAWEDEALKAEAFGARVVRIRTGVVLGDGGALKRMLLPFKMYAGGPIGNGTQWLSWIHKDDEVGIIMHALQNEEISGPVNATAPDPATMKQFGRTLGAVLNRPSWLPVPGFVLKLAMGEMSNMVLTGQRVLPCKALDTGYEFRFDSLDKALANIFNPDQH